MLKELMAAVREERVFEWFTGLSREERASSPDGCYSLPHSLYLAAGRGKALECLRWMLDRGEGGRLQDVMVLAVWSMDAEMVSLLLDMGTNPNVTPPNGGQIPIISALFSSEREMFPMLMERGGDVRARQLWESGGGAYAMGVGWVAVENGKNHALSIMLDKGLSPNERNGDGLSILEFAVDSDNRDACLMLIRAGADVDHVAPGRNFSAIDGIAGAGVSKGNFVNDYELLAEAMARSSKRRGDTKGWAHWARNMDWTRAFGVGVGPYDLSHMGLGVDHAEMVAEMSRMGASGSVILLISTLCNMMSRGGRLGMADVEAIALSTLKMRRRSCDEDRGMDEAICGLLEWLDVACGGRFPASRKCLRTAMWGGFVRSFTWLAGRAGSVDADDLLGDFPWHAANGLENPGSREEMLVTLLEMGVSRGAMVETLAELSTNEVATAWPRGMEIIASRMEVEDIAGVVGRGAVAGMSGNCRL